MPDPLPDADGLAEVRVVVAGDELLELGFQQRQHAVVVGRDLAHAVGEQAEVVAVARLLAAHQAAADHADQVAVQLGRGDAGLGFERLQAGRSAQVQERLENGADDLHSIHALAVFLGGHGRACR